MVDLELRNLRKELQAGKKAVAVEQEKFKIQKEKASIKRQLILMKNPKTFAVAKKLRSSALKAGKFLSRAAIKRQREIAEQQEKSKRRFKGKNKIKTQSLEFNPFGTNF